MLYENFTWTLPGEPQAGVSLRPFQQLLIHPSYEAACHTDEVLQRRFEIEQRRKQEVTNLHNAFGHPHNAALLTFVQHTGLECRYLKRYILTHTCPYCDSNMVRRSNVVSHTPAKVLPLPALSPPFTSYPDCFLTATCECPTCLLSKANTGSCQRRPACKCTKCMDFYNKDGTWNEVWASWHFSRPS